MTTRSADSLRTPPSASTIGTAATVATGVFSMQHVARTTAAMVLATVAPLFHGDETKDCISIQDVCFYFVFVTGCKFNARSKPRKWGHLPLNLFDSFAGGHRRTAGHISANTAPMSVGLGQCRG